MLTSCFLKHLFQETLTFQAKQKPDEIGHKPPVMEMDFRGFLDFAMAMQMPYELASLKFYWRIFDYQQAGYITRSTLSYFLEAILAICEVKEFVTVTCWENSVGRVHFNRCLQYVWSLFVNYFEFLLVA